MSRSFPISKSLAMRVALQLLAVLMVLAVSGNPLLAKTPVHIEILRVDEKGLLPSSRMELRSADWGLAGAELGLKDNQTTGNFLGLEFTGNTFSGTADAILETFAKRYEKGERLFLLAAPAPVLLKAADQFPEALILNVTARDDRLRNEDCRTNLLHVAPSNLMSANALGQYLMWKKWNKWLLVAGSHKQDGELAESYRKTAAKFGANIVDELEFVDQGGARRTDTGHALVQKQVPLFMQEAEDHDVVVAADASDVFANYLPYRTWQPRPVSGSAGLRPVTWSPSHEAWGANQFQNRFEARSSRYAQEEDYQFWLAVRIIGEAVIRTSSTDAKSLREYLLGDDFEIAAFKGTKLDFRDWNGQLRQPILLSDGWLTVSVSPQEGYLHQFSILDSLGTDRSETTCTKFGTK